jgi:glycine/D-amino acid oxidase-like deaminating enzyme
MARKADRPHVVVVGAGAFGGWTAFHLALAGARVTLVDAWGAGHTRASSGGETRVIRHGYSDLRYVELAARSLTLWREWSAAWDRPLFHETGVLFLRQEGHAAEFFEQAAGHLAAAGVPHESLDAGEIAARFPQLNAEGLAGGLFEPTAGYLLARRACAAVAEAVAAAGGELLIASARPGPMQSGMMKTVTLGDGRQLGADSFVFACGPWLGSLFPELLAARLEVTRQEVYYFGTPSGVERYAPPALPVWAIFGDRLWYGIPGGERRGFKLADDTHGPGFEPTAGDRRVSEEGVRRARAFLDERFPGLADAPLTGGRVCQYTNTPDGDFIVDRHPEADNLWLVGGGSGHGFKHGPALGERVAAGVLGRAPTDPAFGITRLTF